MHEKQTEIHVPIMKNQKYSRIAFELPQWIIVYAPLTLLVYNPLFFWKNYMAE